MSVQINKQGLKRDIPDPIKRAVRQRDGFGCIICGNAMIDYEHFDPEFEAATKHDADGIILLCPSHHRKKGGFLSRSKIEAARLNPKAKQQGSAREAFELGCDSVKLQLGTLTLEANLHAIVIEADPIFSVLPPEEPGGPYRINALMTDREGKEVLHIVENEFRTPISNWDVQVQEKTIQINRGSRDVVLRLRLDQPGALVVERLHMSHRGTTITVNEGKPAQFTTANSSWGFKNSTIKGGEVGLWSSGGRTGIGGTYAEAVARSILGLASLA